MNLEVETETKVEEAICPVFVRQLDAMKSLPTEVVDDRAVPTFTTLPGRMLNPYLMLGLIFIFLALFGAIVAMSANGALANPTFHMPKLSTLMCFMGAR